MLLTFKSSHSQTVELETYCCLVASEGLEVLDFLKLRADDEPCGADGLLQRKPSGLDATGVLLPLALLPAGPPGLLCLLCSDHIDSTFQTLAECLPQSRA